MKATNKNELKKQLKNEVKNLMKNNNTEHYYFYIEYDFNNKMHVVAYQFKVEDNEAYYLGEYYNEHGLIDYSDNDDEEIEMFANDIANDMIETITL